jgi:hypothetical protein
MHKSQEVQPCTEFAKLFSNNFSAKYSVSFSLFAVHPQWKIYIRSEKMLQKFILEYTGPRKFP